jgi:hypothetical protein
MDDNLSLVKSKKSLEQTLNKIFILQEKFNQYFNSEDHQINTDNFYNTNAEILCLMNELNSRNYGEKVNYYELLGLKLKVAIRDEDYLSAAKIHLKREYFWVSFLDRHPKKYLPE